MTRDNKTIVLDFEGYSHYLVPYRNQVVSKEHVLTSEFHIVKTDYVHMQIASPDMEPVVQHDSFAFGEIVDLGEVSRLNEGVFAACMLDMDSRRIAQIVVGRLKEPPKQNITLWSERPNHIPKKVLPLKNVAFLFRLIWSAPRELYLIIPR